MFQGLVWQFDLIFSLFTIPKCDLIEVEKAIFQGLACHFELIFGILANPKCDLGETKRNFDFFQVDKARIQVAEW